MLAILHLIAFTSSSFKIIYSYFLDIKIILYSYQSQMLKDAGFDEVIAEDRTDQFKAVLERELSAVEKDKDSFVQDFSQVRFFLVSMFFALIYWILYPFILLIPCDWQNKQEDYDDIVGGWKAKLVRVDSGEQKWGLFIAKKNWSF